jgi:hypothetical protein
VLQQIRWTDPGSPLFSPGQCRRLPASVPIAELPDAESAAAACRTLDEPPRQLGGPFVWGGPALFYLTSLDSAGLAQQLRQAGITRLPRAAAGYRAWQSWWDREHQRLTQDQRQAVWEALDKVRFGEIRECPTVSAYVVLQIAWKLGVGTGDQMDSDCEGGYVRRAFRSRSPAEAYLRELDQELRDQARSFHEELWHDFLRRIPETESEALSGVENPTWYSYRLVRLSGSLAPGGPGEVGDVPFAELVEVPAWGGPVGSTAYLLERVALDPQGNFCRNNNGDFTEGQVPLGLYADRQQAEAECIRRETAARHGVSPFAFPSGHEPGMQGDHVWASSGLSYTRFRNEIRALGLCPPPLEWGGDSPVSPTGHCLFYSKHWLEWWDAQVDRMTPEQREAIWQLLDEIRFHRVTEVQVEQ